MLNYRSIHNLILGKGIRRRLSVLLSFLLLLSFTSCGSGGEAEAPALLTPVALTEACRPVERRDIGEVEFLRGTVTPEAYPVYTGKSIMLYELKVDPGDEVKAGDVIATGDTRSIDAEIKTLNNELEMLQLSRSTEDSISKKMEEQLKYKKKAAEETGFSELAKEYDREIRKEQESRRYSLASYDASIASLKKQINEQKKNKDGMTFTAPHSGRVTYLRDISSSNYVSANENIAVISDFDMLSIESDVITKSYKYENYQEKYIMVEGRKIPVEEIPYTSAELSYADNMGSYPLERFKAEGVELEPGATVPIYFVRNSRTGVLVVGNDSIYTEEEETYCYVKNADGEKEKRTIETGAKDNLYSEVISGLSEGEMVFYDSTSVIPVNFTQYTVNTGDYVEENYSEYITELLTKHNTCLAEVNGSVKEVKAKVGSDVEKGDEILTLEIPVSRGELAEARNGLKDLEAGRKSQLQEYDRKEREIKDAINALKNESTVTAVIPEKADDEAGEVSGGDDAPEESDTEGNDMEESDTEEPAPDENIMEEPDNSVREAERDRLYKKECLQLDLEILDAERKLSAREYSNRKAILQEQQNRLSGFGTDGSYTVKAEISGKLGQSLPAVSAPVYTGEYLFTVNSQGKKLLRISMPKKRGQDTAKAARAGQKITLKTEDKEYMGTCVAENGFEDRVYLFTRDGDVHITRSVAYSSGQTEQFFVELEDESYFEGEELPSAIAIFQAVVIHGGITIPAKSVYTEKDTMTDNVSYFVWKQTDLGLAKQEVAVFENGQFSEERLILSGLSAGDVIAVE